MGPPPLRVLPALLLLASCGTAPRRDEPLPPDLAAQAAGEFAAADCKRTFECMPYAALTRAFGDDEADCTRQVKAYATRAYKAPGSSQDFTGVRACIEEMKAATCQDWLDMKKGLVATKLPACMAITPGSLENGAPCAYGRQCASGFCHSAEGQCGKCEALGQKVGDACDPAEKPCDPSKGVLCNPDTKICFLPRPRGRMCQQHSDCYYNLLCLEGECSDYHATEGDACDSSVGDCSFGFGQGLVCNPKTDQCERALATAKVGEACGFSPATGKVTVCEKGAMCDGEDDGFNGKCVAGHAAKPGESCLFEGAGANGSACESEARCVQGKCVVDDPRRCE